VSSPLVSLPQGFAATVASLHEVAERIVAPARKPDNEIALEPAPEGYGTPEFELGGVRQRVRVQGGELVRDVDGAARRTPLTSLAAAGALVADLLPDGGSALGTEPLTVDREAALALARWCAFGVSVLDRLRAEATASDAATAPILWPEHFDLAIELGEEGAGRRATYGFSPGDDNHAEPYAYVAPWVAQPPGGPWNATGFGGAELGYARLLVADDPEGEALAFLRAGRDALAATQPDQEER
jgi:hypothetical protein